MTGMSASSQRSRNLKGEGYIQAQEIANTLPDNAWRSVSAGAGSKGERRYDWALAPLFRWQPTEEERHYGHYLLIRRQ